MNKILFDLSAAQSSNGIINHGGSEYAKAVFIRLVNSPAAKVTVFFNTGSVLDDEIINLLEKHSIERLEDSNIVTLKNYIIEKNINIFYSALLKGEYKSFIKMQSSGFRVILTIHGLRQLELPADSYEFHYCRTLKSKLKYAYKKLLPLVYKKSILNYYRQFLGASELITVSNHSKGSLQFFFPELEPERIHVFYSPITDYKIIMAPDSIKKLILSRRKYFLLLSGSIWTKNSIRAIKAFDELISCNRCFSEYKMLITGATEAHYKPRNKQNFIFTNYISRISLEELYQNALALVYPSLNEGFGYPPLEAMKYGVPVLASGTGPIPEVCGDAAKYFNPNSETEIGIRLSECISDADLFSQNNILIRQNQYNNIRSKQMIDLENLVNLLCI